MKLSLGFSPCPNDTFIFDALIHHKIDTEGFTFEVAYEDVETLNKNAFAGTYDITKLSYHAYAYLTEAYVMMNSGGALGFGVGPLLLCNNEKFTKLDFLQAHYKELRIGIPGEFTTANLLLSLAFPDAKNKINLVFSEIEKELLNGRIDLGVIIHENRFTYQDKGLLKILDLGEFWEKRSGFPIPLGGIVSRRTLPEDVKIKINRVIERSVRFAIKNPTSGLGFIRSHAQEMSGEVIYKHIELYVNKFSVDLGSEGKKAVNALFKEGLELNIIPEPKQSLFL